MPAGKRIRRTAPPQVGQVVSGSSDIFCQVSKRVPQFWQRYSYVGIAEPHPLSRLGRHIGTQRRSWAVNTGCQPGPRGTGNRVTPGAALISRLYHVVPARSRQRLVIGAELPDGIHQMVSTWATQGTLVIVGQLGRYIGKRTIRGRLRHSVSRRDLRHCIEMGNPLGGPRVSVSRCESNACCVPWMGGGADAGRGYVWAKGIGCAAG